MHLKENWPESGLLGAWGRWANQISRLFNGATGYDGAQVFLSDRGLEVYGSQGGDDGGCWARVYYVGISAPGFALYDWVEQRVRGNGWELEHNPSGRSSEGASVGTRAEPRAQPVSSLRHLPDETLVWMSQAAGGWRFSLPSSPDSFPAQIMAGGPTIYTAAFYEAGRGQPSTGSGQIEILSLNPSETIPSGTWVIAHRSAMVVTGGDD